MATAQSPLTNLGYNMVAWPKTGIHPLALLYKTTNGVAAVEADLDELFDIADVTPPQVKEGGTAADIKGSAEMTFDAKAGVSMLDWLLNKLNLGKMKADITLNNSYEVTVSYLNVKQDNVSLLALDKFISKADPNMAGFNSFKDKLENNELYVINAVAKSNNISVTISAKNGQDVSVDATIKGIMDANATAARKQNNTMELVYKMDEPVIFAFKAQQIIYESASFWNGNPAHFYIKDQEGAVLMGDEDFPSRPLNTGDELVDL